jgi:hypothetical protein
VQYILFILFLFLFFLLLFLFFFSFGRYDPETDSWKLISTMLTRRIGVGCAALNRLLFAVGGFDGANRLSSVECYNPERDEWKMVASMNTMRSGAGSDANKIIFCWFFVCLFVFLLFF